MCESRKNFIIKIQYRAVVRYARVIELYLTGSLEIDLHLVLHPRHSVTSRAEMGGLGDFPNFIIFGEMGVGKSSLINLIAGEALAKSSPDAGSCTLESTEYEIRLHLPNLKLDVNLFDTVSKHNQLTCLTQLEKSYRRA